LFHHLFRHAIVLLGPRFYIHTNTILAPYTIITSTRFRSLASLVSIATTTVIRVVLLLHRLIAFPLCALLFSLAWYFHFLFCSSSSYPSCFCCFSFPFLLSSLPFLYPTLAH
jgi:hypothetical protein